VLKRPTALAAVALAAVAGCGSSSSDKGADTNASPPAAAPGAVSMKSLAFQPAKTTVAVGDKVTWTNDDTVDHNVTATRGAKFMSRAFPKGGSYSYTPRKPGTIAYVCTLHPGMKATLVVTR
jgi:plastocyanin